MIAGTPAEIVIPSLGRFRTGPGRLRGLRLVHTHLRDEPLSRDDLADLAMLRLDLVMAIGADGEGRPLTAYIASLDPARTDQEPWRVEEPESFSRVGFNFGEFIKGLEDEFSRADTRRVEKGVLRAVLVHVSGLQEPGAEMRMQELSELARTEKIEAVEKVIYRGVPHPRSLLGPGRMKDLVIRSLARNADMILFDQELSPAQARWIGGLTDLPILDRTQLILRIFAKRAGSKDGKLRVELARLKYTLPRLGLKDDALSRIRGGIGVRGPGETAMEVSRRRIKDRISKTREKLERLGHGREQRRGRRKRSGVPQVAVIGYTNAGKSTLLNAITKSAALVEDKLFATLDPMSRRIRFPREMEVVMSDTVGFIRDLPEDLLDAFRSTLEDLRDADLLLHLVDISDSDFEEQIKTVESVLARLGLERIPRRLVFNKTDLAGEEIVRNLARRHNAIPISAANRTGLDRLTDALSEDLEKIPRRGAAGNEDKAAAR